MANKPSVHSKVSNIQETFHFNLFCAIEFLVPLTIPDVTVVLKYNNNNNNNNNNNINNNKNLLLPELELFLVFHNSSWPLQLYSCVLWLCPYLELLC